MVILLLYTLWYSMCLLMKYQQFVMIKQSPLLDCLKSFPPPECVPTLALEAYQLPPPAWLMTQKLSPHPDPRGGRTLWLNIIFLTLHLLLSRIHYSKHNDFSEHLWLPLPQLSPPTLPFPTILKLQLIPHWILTFDKICWMFIL